MGMVVRSNIMAVNAQRQLGMNNSSVGKALEKLSSGYRINRAGDDASGLAISEKMKAQIKGLDTASLNAQDGVSVVQTAEGALTEVHNMLNRMTELATRAANGINSDQNRQSLQDEIKELQTEIDRISKATNFNSINLLDGSLGGGTSGAAGVPAINGDGLGNLTETAATVGKSEIAVNSFTNQTGLKAGDSVVFTLTVNEGGTSKNIDIELTVGTDNKSFLYNGEIVGSAFNAAGTATAAEQGKALTAAINKHADLKKSFTATENAGAITLTHKVKGKNAPSITLIEAPGTAGADKSTATTVTDGVDAFQSGSPVSDQVFTVNGKKFMFASNADKAAAADPNVTVVVQAAGTIAQGDLEKMAALIEKETGYKPMVNGISFEWKSDAKNGKAGNGLVLQIGDTADSFNQITVSIDDMSSKGIGVAGVDISSREGAAAAIDTIRAGIDKVSAQRAVLGATQNRLEYTIDNLDTTSENIQAANSRIRDTDMAKMMMEYTKMNVLTQSAQAMLAQANQQPQSVLQLLQ